MNFKRLVLLMSVFSVLVGASPLASAAETELTPYRLAVFPYIPPREIEKTYSQVAKDFAEVLGRPVVLHTSTSYPNFIDAMKSEQFELAFVQPFDYVEFAETMSYRPIATRDSLLRAVVVVPQDSKIDGWDDLRGKKLALTPRSAAVTYLIHNELRKREMVIDKDIFISYHRSHVSCMQQIKVKKADACGTAGPAVRFFENKMKVKLKQVVESDPIPHSLFISHPKVPLGESNLIRKRLLEWGRTEEGKKFLKGTRLSKFRKVEDIDYDIVRSMKQK